MTTTLATSDAYPFNTVELCGAACDAFADAGTLETDYTWVLAFTKLLVSSKKFGSSAVTNAELRLLASACRHCSSRIIFRCGIDRTGL